MRRPPAPRRGQIGNYWLSKKTRKDRSDPMWYRTWYDAAARQTCRVGLGTTDFQEATVRLAAWIVENERTHLATPDEVLIESILLNYWNDYAKDLPSAETQRLGLLTGRSSGRSGRSQR
jgi:hypothetical protein